MSPINIGALDAQGIIFRPSATITRPADTTAYASGDLVANSTTAGSVAYGTLAVGRDKAGMSFLRRCQLSKSGTGVTNASFRVHLFGGAKTFDNGDNGAFSTTRAGYIGAMDVTVDRVFSDGAEGFGVPIVGSEMAVAGTALVWWALEARGAYTPASAETFTLTLDAYPA